MSSVTSVSPQITQPFYMPVDSPFKVKEIFSDEFQGSEKAKLARTDEKSFLSKESMAPLKKESISSVEMGDCITIFGIERGADKEITQISAYHVPSGTREPEMKKVYFSEFENKKESVSFYIIGGDRRSGADAGTSLFSTIKKAINSYFGNTNCIQGYLVGINGGAKGKYSSANIQMDGTLTYWFH